MLRRRLALFVAMTSALGVAMSATATSVPSTADSTEETGGTTIVVDPGESLRPISQDLFGFNQRFENNGMLSYDPDNDRIYPKLLNEVRNTGASVLRYPGGTTANPFRWKRAIGPQSERECQLNGVTAAPAGSTYGVDEHARFAEAAGATTNIVVNFDTGSPAEAADWVEYMNAPVGTNPNGGTAWAQVRADNGHSEPYGVTWWEVGNEVAGHQTWLGQLPGNERNRAYVVGGTAQYTGVPVGKKCDQRDEASISDGSASQEFKVRRTAIDPGSQTVYVGGAAWQRVDDLGAAGSSDTVYELDNETGRISFGDGVHGAIPPEGQRVTIDYSSTRPGYVDFYQAMKAVDPDIEVCSAVRSVGALGDRPFDCVVDHRYRRGASLETALDTHDDMMRRADNHGESAIRFQRRLHNANPDADTVLTEYGMFLGRGDAGPTEGFLRSLVQGLYTASELTYWIEAGIPLADKHPLINPNPADPPPGAVVFPSGNQSPFGFYPNFVPQAAAHVTNLFSHMIGSEQVAGTVVNGPVRTNSTSGARYDSLRVVASTDEQGRVTLIVVNRDPEQDVPAAVLPERFRYQGDAEVWTVNADTLAAYNSPEDPDAVSLTKQAVEVDQGGFDYTFPAHSVTAIRLSSAGDDSLDPVHVEPGDEVEAERGEQTTTTVEITNSADPAESGPRRAAGELTVRGPAGWAVNISPDSYALQPGQSMQATVTLSVPEDTDATEAGLVVGAHQHGVVADTGIVDVGVLGLPGTEWDPLFTDTFDDDPVGQPPQEWTVTGPTGAVTVQQDGDGNVMVNERAEQGTATIGGTRSFGAPAGDVRLSYRIRADQTHQGMAVQLLDVAGNPVARFNIAKRGVFKYSDGSSVRATDIRYETGTWYQIDLVFHASTGRYEAYVDGERAAEAARWPGSGQPAAVGTLIGPGNPEPARYAVDDVSVMVPAEE